jgi:hypothetical protein
MPIDLSSGRRGERCDIEAGRRVGVLGDRERRVIRPALRQKREAPVPLPTPSSCLQLRHGGLTWFPTGLPLALPLSDARDLIYTCYYIGSSFFQPSSKDVEEVGHRG